MKSSDYILIQAPMVQDLKLKGVLLLVFARIHSFTKDGKRHFQCSYSDLAEWTGTDRRSVVEAIDLLLEAGYINRYTSTLSNRDKRPLNEYDTNYEALLDRVRFGEIFEPLKRKSRKKINSGADTTNLHHQSTAIENGGADTTPSVVQTPKNGGADTTPHLLNDVKASINYFSLDTPCPLQEQEKQDFFEIFFVKNALRPMAEMERFVAYNSAKKWRSEVEDDKGRKKVTLYDTPASRLGLAKMWHFESTDPRLTAQFGTDKEKAEQRLINTLFLDFIDKVYEMSKAIGGIDAFTLLDVRSSMVIQRRDDKPVVFWRLRQETMDWWTANKGQGLQALMNKTFDGYVIKPYILAVA